MTTANATFSGIDAEKSRRRAADANERVSPNRLVLNDDPYEYIQKTTIYFYNVSPQPFRFSRPPNHQNVFIPGCAPGERYAEAPGTIEHPFREIHEDQNGNKIPVATNGFREATRLLNPMNPGVDQGWDDPASIAQGGNLNLYGVFWSVNNPPEEEELQIARKRMEETYRKELEIMAAVEAKEGVDGARGRANDVSRAAANYFGKSFSWHRIDLEANHGEERTTVRCGVCANDIFSEAVLCIHCGAPTDEEKRERWLEAKFSDKRTRATA